MDIDQQMQNVLNVTGDDPLSDVMEDEGEKNRRITQDATMWGDINDDGTIDEAMRNIPEDSSSPDFEYVDDEGNIAEITVEELPPAPKPEPAPINVVSTQEFGRQSFSVTPDGKVYINDRKTGKPKAEVTDQFIKESVLDQNKQFIRGAVTTFFTDAEEKGYTNDKARLLEAWKRFASKNRLSSYVTQQVLKSIDEGR